MRFARVCLLALLASVFAGCHHGPTEQEKQVMAQVNQSMKTQCIGRYLVDLPSSFYWSDPNMTLYYGRNENFKTLEVDVLDFKATPESVAKAVAAHAAKLGREINDGTGKSNLIAQVKEGNADGVMLSYYSDSSGTAGIKHELHVLIGTAYVLIKGSSYENVSEAKEDLSPAVETRMLKLAANIHPVTDPEKAGPGFCLGSVVVDSDNDFESANMTFGMAKHPDIRFNVWMDNQDNAPDSLLDRMKSFDAAADGRHLTILRSRNLTFVGVPAQEKAAKIVEDRDEYHFVLESRPPSPSFAQEGVNVSLTTGNQLDNGRYISSTLTENEVVALWEAIVTSFRSRPNAVRPTTK
jgi:hypothetical protein